MKRFFLSAVFAAFFSTFLYSNSSRSIEQYVEAGSGYVVAKNVEKEFIPFNLAYSIKQKTSDIKTRFSAISAIQFSDNIFDFTLGGDYYFPFASWQTDNASIDLGTGAVYHFQYFYNLFTEDDFLGDLIFRFICTTKFQLIKRFGIGFKTSQVESLSVSSIWEFNFTTSLEMRWFLKHGFEFSGGYYSHDLFRYPLVFSPTYFIGGFIPLKSGFAAGTDICVRFRDQIVVAPYVDRVSWNLKLRYTF